MLSKFFNVISGRDKQLVYKLLLAIEARESSPETREYMCSEHNQCSPLMAVCRNKNGVKQWFNLTGSDYRNMTLGA